MWRSVWVLRVVRGGSTETERHSPTNFHASKGVLYLTDEFIKMYRVKHKVKLFITYLISS